MLVFTLWCLEKMSLISWILISIDLIFSGLFPGSLSSYSYYASTQFSTKTHCTVRKVVYCIEFSNIAYISIVWASISTFLGFAELLAHPRRQEHRTYYDMSFKNTVPAMTENSFSSFFILMQRIGWPPIRQGLPETIRVFITWSFTILITR